MCCEAHVPLCEVYFEVWLVFTSMKFSVLDFLQVRVESFGFESLFFTILFTNSLSDNYHAPAKTDNFWEMGSTGPCGPCTEIFYDVNGVLKEGQKFTMEHIDLLEEIWNIVMIKYNKVSEGTLTPLAKNHIDTGVC